MQQLGKKIKKYRKYLDKKLNIPFWIGIFSTSALLAGVLVQTILLSRYNAITFFSWTQVLSDSVIIIIPLIFFFIGFYINSYFFKVKINKFKKFLGIIGMILFIIIFLSVWEIFFGSVNSYLFIIFSYYLLGFVTYYFFNMGYRYNKQEDYDGKKDIIAIPTLPLLLFLLMYYLLFWFISREYDFLYQYTKIQIDGIEYEIKYMNDKYIIYFIEGKNKIIKNNEKVEFNIKTK